MIRTDLGAVTAYAYAVEGGYEGSENQFKTDMENIAGNSARLSTLENAVDILDTTVNGLSGDLEGVASRLTTAESDIDSLESDVSGLSGDLATESSKIDSLYPADTTLSIDGKAADAKSVGDEFSALRTDLSNNAYSFWPESLYDTSQYSSSISLSTFLISDVSIEAGSLITCISVYAFSSSSRAYLCFIDASNNKIKFIVTSSLAVGWNRIPIEYSPDTNVVFGIYGHTLKARSVYVSTATEQDIERKFSTGYIEGDIKPPVVGSTVTLNQYSTDRLIQLPVQVTYIKDGDRFGVSSNVKVDELDGVLSAIVNPLETSADYYNSEISFSSFLISTKIISAGTFVRSILLHNTENSTSLYIYIIDNSTKKIIFKLFLNNINGYAAIPVNYYCKTNCVIGIYGHTFRARVNNEYKENYFSLGYVQGESRSYQIGEVVETTTSLGSKYIELPISWEIRTQNGGKTGGLFDSKQYDFENEISNHGCFISFIDDDTGRYVRNIWDEIIGATGIRMGFACVTGYISGEHVPSRDAYLPMQLSELRELYNAGHEVYSHSYTHPAFYESSYSEIEMQCMKSKIWLDNNGFSRNSDIIIYPGGLGFARTTAQAIVSQFYKWGVEATGDGKNVDQEMLMRPYTIFRANADTLTLSELQEQIDRASDVNAFLVFMNHAYELYSDRSNQIAKMIACINYAKEKGTVLPFSEALHRCIGWKR